MELKEAQVHPGKRKFQGESEELRMPCSRFRVWGLGSFATRPAIMHTAKGLGFRVDISTSEKPRCPARRGNADGQMPFPLSTLYDTDMIHASYL